MKKVLVLLMLAPFMAASQEQIVVNSSRYFCKQDKVAEFEKSLTAHVQKYHNGDWKWRVYSIDTGPDAGGYMIVEGPKSWTQFDTRGDLGAEHTADWNKNVSAFLIDKYSSFYLQYHEDLSTVAVGDFSDKISVNHVYAKPGRGMMVEENLKRLRKVWQEGSQTVAVYTSESSGPSQYVLVTRYKQGLKEREPGFRKPFRERYEAIHGKDGYSVYLASIQDNTDNSWTELLSLRKDLSSK